MSSVDSTAPDPSVVCNIPTPPFARLPDPGQLFGACRHAMPPLDRGHFMVDAALTAPPERLLAVVAVLGDVDAQAMLSAALSVAEIECAWTLAGLPLPEFVS